MGIEGLGGGRVGEETVVAEEGEEGEKDKVDGCKDRCAVKILRISPLPRLTLRKLFCVLRQHSTIAGKSTD